MVFACDVEDFFGTGACDVEDFGGIACNVEDFGVMFAGHTGQLLFGIVLFLCLERLTARWRNGRYGQCSDADGNFSLSFCFRFPFLLSFRVEDSLKDSEYLK